MRVILMVLVVAVSGESGAQASYDLPHVHANCTQNVAELIQLHQEYHLSELVSTVANMTEIQALALSALNDVSQSLTTLLSQQGNDHSQNLECTPPFSIKLRKNCYHLGMSERHSWWDARLYCARLGGDLATFPDIITFAEVLDYLNTVDIGIEHIWIGATDQNDKKTWEWVTGGLMPMGQPFWLEGEPSNRDNEDCARLYFKEDVKYKICDWDCSTALISLCQQLVQ